MKKKLVLMSFILLLRAISLAQDQNPYSTYKKMNGADNNFIYLNKNGTFLTQLLGGCDGSLESQGKWKINKDTLSFTNIEVRILNDPWKKTAAENKYLIKKNSIISFSIVDNKMLLDSNEVYKKVKNKK